MGACGKELDFEFTDGLGNHMGIFKKIHNGCVNECFTGADRYDVSLPADERDAALVLAAIQMLDMIYFENPYDCCRP